ncbi:MAG TPA: hypothetical protein VGI31_12665 [Streptosporangiaceae bacterium]
MTEPHDDLDAWLHTDVNPLPPPPGTFELIRKRARRRKARSALVSAASAGVAAAVIVTAIVALPKVVPSVLHQHPTGNSAAADNSPSSPASSPQSPKPLSSGSRSATLALLPPVPAHFEATSATFVGLKTGWVIGQAGTPGACYTQYCTSIARTDNTGVSWYGVPAPATGAPDGSTGVSQLRFLDLDNGWAFGPQLWATHDGGHSWTKISTGSLRVLSLATGGSEAFAVLGQGCTGAGSDFAAGCSQYFLWSSPANSDAWAPVPGLSGFTAADPAAGSATVVLSNGVGYFYTPAGLLESGPTGGPTGSGGAWTQVSATPLPCLPGAAQPDGQPSAGQLAATTPGNLALACPDTQVTGSALRDIIYTSVNGGQSWQQRGTVGLGAAAYSLAAASGGGLVLGTGAGIYYSSDYGASWHQTLTAVSGGFSYVGMTSPAQGVTVPAQPQQQAIWFTLDGGQQWLVSAIRS